MGNKSRRSSGPLCHQKQNCFEANLALHPLPRLGLWHWLRERPVSECGLYVSYAPSAFTTLGGTVVARPTVKWVNKTSRRVSLACQPTSTCCSSGASPRRPMSSSKCESEASVNSSPVARSEEHTSE